MAEDLSFGNGGDGIRRLPYPDYRKLLENPSLKQGAETIGIYDEDTYHTVGNDSRTTSVVTPDEAGKPSSVPVLVPLEALSWFNLPYHQRYAGEDTPLRYYGHQPLLLEPDRTAYTHAMRPGFQALAEQKGVIVVDYNNHAADRTRQELATIALDLSVTLTPVPGPEGNTTPHYHYADIARPIVPDSAARTNNWSLYEAFEAGKRDGSITDQKVTVSPSLSNEAIEKIWKFYKPAFDKLTENDPVEAGFSETEFTDLMHDRDCYKFVYEEPSKDGTTTDIVNLCTLINVKKLPWMNQYFYQQQFPEQYALDQVFCSPGVIANPERSQGLTSLHTMGMLGTVVRLAGNQPVLTFACDTQSNKNVPRLSDMSMEEAGIITNYYQNPVSEQYFDMYRVTPA